MDKKKDLKIKGLIVLIKLLIMVFIAYLIFHILYVSYSIGYMMGAIDQMAISCPLVK